MRLVGHRCCRAQYPENTIRAARFAGRHVDRVEIDVRRCGSGELVVFCDDTLERLTGVHGRVDRLEWDLLRELEVLGSGETIPRFVDLLEATPPGTGLDVDLKDDGLVDDVADAAAAAENDVTVIGADPGRLAAARDRAEVSTGYVSYLESDPIGALETAIDLGCDAVEVHLAYLIESDLVARAHEAGVEVVVGGGGSFPHEAGVDDARVRDALAAAGADGVLVDRWDAFE